jgi:hypothetical protein
MGVDGIAKARFAYSRSRLEEYASKYSAFFQYHDWWVLERMDRLHTSFHDFILAH